METQHFSTTRKSEASDKSKGEEKLTFLKEYPLSLEELEELSGYPVVVYSDLLEHDNLEMVFQTYGPGFTIIYLQEPSYGHYCCLQFTLSSEDKLSVQFFDPYGYFPDSQLSWTGPDVLDQDEKHLTLLLKTCPPDWEIHFNEYEYQDRDSESQTCGFHCSNFLKKGLSIPEYKTLMDTISQEYDLTYDDIVIISSLKS